MAFTNHGSSVRAFRARSNAGSSAMAWNSAASIRASCFAPNAMMPRLSPGWRRTCSRTSSTTAATSASGLLAEPLIPGLAGTSTCRTASWASAAGKVVRLRW